MNENTFNKHADLLFFFCWLTYACSYVGRLNYSACMADIMSSLEITKTYAGSIGTGFLACYGIGQLINGLLGDKVSPKAMIFIGLTGSGAANIIIGLNSSPVLLLILWCLNGYFNSMLWSPVICCFSRWMTQQRQKRAARDISTTIPVGTILCYLISSVTLKFLNWRYVFMIIGVFLLCIAAVWFLGMSGIRSYLTAAEERRQAEIETLDTQLRTNQKIRLIPLILSSGLVFVVIGILFNGIIKDGVTQWIPTYITENFSVTSSAASLSSVILPIVNLTGAYCAVQLNEKRIHNEMTTSVYMFLISSVSLILLLLFGRFSLITSVFFIAVATSAMLGANTMFLTFIPLKFSAIGRSASVTGFLNACSYFSSALSTVTIGVISQTRGWTATIFSWILTAVLGMIFCAAGIRVWRINRNKYTVRDEAKECETV